MAFYLGPGGAGDATSDATNAAILVVTKAGEASVSAANAANSAASAATSATSASASATTALSSITTSATSASSAATSASNAAASATAAASSASSVSTDAANAANSATSASGYATTASTAATNAATSASTATTQASNASASASSASTSASAASTSASNAATSATSAANSATAAAASAASVVPLPSQSGNSGKYLSTNGTSTLWSTIPAIPTLISAFTNDSGYAVATTVAATYATKAVPVITGLKEVRTAMGANDIDLTTANYFSKTISGATTLTVSNIPTTGTANSFLFDVTNGGSAVITWFSGVKWAAGTAPTLTAAGRDTLGFFTYDGGTTWTGLVLGKDIK